MSDCLNNLSTECQKFLICGCCYCIWPAGAPELNADSVRAAEQRSELKCLCCEVICHLRGFPHLGVGRRGKDRYSVVFISHAAVPFVYMFTIVKKTGSSLR